MTEKMWNILDYIMKILKIMQKNMFYSFTLSISFNEFKSTVIVLYTYYLFIHKYTMNNEELNEISDISPEQHIENSSRALLKKKVREARLKVAIAKIKAEKLAAKYFRRYGNDLDVSYESDLSSDSDE